MNDFVFWVFLLLWVIGSAGVSLSIGHLFRLLDVFVLWAQIKKVFKKS